MPKLATATPEHLRPFASHGLDPSWRDGDREAVADCPLCGAERKLGIEIASSKWKCLVCGANGNSTTFLHELHAASVAATTDDDLAELAADRGLLNSRTLSSWGAAKSAVTGEWLLPAHNCKGKLCNLFRYAEDPAAGKRVLRSTSGMNLHMFGIPLLLDDCEEVWVLESWNALAMWETLGIANERGVGVLGVPGCNVFQPQWCQVLAGKRVVVVYDSDHPRTIEKTGRVVQPGYDGVRRTVQMLSASSTPPASISYLAWGPEGYDPDLKNGWDVRDHLTQSAAVSVRVTALSELRDKVRPAPGEWLEASGTVAAPGGGKERLQPVPCGSWENLLNSLRQALRSRQDIEDVFAVMLAVCASTSQVGDQLFLQVVADAGSSKTRLCDAMLVSSKCFALEDFNSLYSGYKGKDGQDYSLIDRINHKTLITPEGDVIMSSNNFETIMSQFRRVFDGSGGKTFGNSTDDTRRSGLRTPWIMAGTPAMLDKNQSRLGDRFIKVFINPPSSREKSGILQSVGYTALRSVRQTSNGDASTSIEEVMREFYQLTGGYVDWLRDNMERLIQQLVINDEWVVEECSKLAEFTAFMRARPAPPRKDGGETHDTKELPSRLTHQFVRLACCLAVVLNRPGIDDEVLRIVRKVSLDTARGRTLDIARVLDTLGDGAHGKKVGTRTWGRFLGDVAARVTMGEDSCTAYLRFLRGVGIVEPFHFKGEDRVTRWKLSETVEELYRGVVG